MTFSVAAVDQDAGLMGVAVQSHWLAVGAIVPWAAAGTGRLVGPGQHDAAADRAGRDPLAELERLCVLGEAYREHELGLGVLAADPGQALAHWTRAAALAPSNEELEFWRAIALASAGQRTEARQILSPLLRSGPGWRSMLQRLPAAGLLPGDPGLLGGLLRDSPDVPQRRH